MNILKNITRALLMVGLFSLSMGAFAVTIVLETSDTKIDTTDDLCSLSEAILNANNDNALGDGINCTAGSGPDTIEMPIAFSPYSSATDEGTLALLPTIDDDLILDGKGSTLEPGGALSVGVIRIFAKAGPVTNTVSIKDLIVTGGDTSSVGGGIRAQGVDLTLDQVTVTDNDAGFEGGGVYIARANFGGGVTVSSSLMVIDSEVTDNTAGTVGGGIRSQNLVGADISLDSKIDGNTADREGGGIFNSSGPLTITDSFVRENSSGTLVSARDGGGIMHRSNPGTSAPLTVMDSEITDNVATGHGGGIRVVFVDDGASISGSKIDGNEANFDGGGIRQSTSGPLTISDSVIEDNIAGGFGGGVRTLSLTGDLTISGTTIDGNSGTRGGGIRHSSSPSMKITDSFITGNTATTDDGGGIELAFNSAPSEIRNTTISGNTAGDFGGGINADQADYELVNSTVSDNEAKTGGALFVAGDSIVDISHSTLSGNHATLKAGTMWIEDSSGTITNSTLSGNTAVLGDVFELEGGGGTWVVSSDLEINNSTITTADRDVMDPRESPALILRKNDDPGPDATVTLYSSIVALGVDGMDANADDCRIFNQATDVTSAGWNIDSDDTCNLGEGSDKENETLGAINLGPLADNGGVGIVTETHALLSGSIAIDMGDCALSGVTEDQRFFMRPAGSDCDIGAYEDHDEDDDGVVDDDDLCLGTTFPEESILSDKLRPTRWAVDDDGTGMGTFVTIDPEGLGPENDFTLEQTQGCSCEDIVALSGVGKGHLKHGCSISVMEEFIDSLD